MDITITPIGRPFASPQVAQVVRVERYRVLTSVGWFSRITGRSVDGRWQADLTVLDKPRRLPPIAWVA